MCCTAGTDTIEMEFDMFDMTPEQISKLSDPHINVLVTATVSGASTYREYPGLGKIEYVDNSTGVEHIIDVIDYCNSPASMMPVAFASGISILKQNEYQMFTAFTTAEINDYGSDIIVMPKHRFDDAKPCRAAAIVYLMSKGVL